MVRNNIPPEKDFYVIAKNLHTTKLKFCRASELHELKDDGGKKDFEPEHVRDFRPFTDYGMRVGSDMISHWIVAMTSE